VDANGDGFPSIGEMVTYTVTLRMRVRIR